MEAFAIACFAESTEFSYTVLFQVLFFQAGLQEKLLVLHNKLDWLERLDITCPVQHTRAEKDNEDLDTEFDVHDDFKREMAL